MTEVVGMADKYKKTEGNCVSLPTDYWTTSIMTSMVYVDFVIAGLLPFTIMLVCNIIIIIKLIENRKKMAGITTKKSGPDLVNLTTTLLVVSFAYIMLTSPSTFLVLGWNYFGITSGHSSDSVKLCGSLSKVLLNMNNALNFIQYACIGKKFRGASKEILYRMAYDIKKCYKCKE